MSDNPIFEALLIERWADALADVTVPADLVVTS